MRHVPETEYLRVAGFDRPGGVVAWVRHHTLHPGVFTGAFRFDAAAAIAVGEIRQHFELLVVFLVLIFERHVLAAAFELVPRTGRLERILRILRAAQPARHTGFCIVIVEIGQ